MAAGLGFKDFTTGEVLTAADVDGYLMQGIWVFANATARDAAVTSPQEGNFAFTKDNNSLWYYDGAAWVASGATGDIEGVTAGVGISGGGTSGTVTITNSMATAIDAKGDLVVGTGADTFSKLPVGSNNTTLIADSAESTGLKYAASLQSTLTTTGDTIYASGANTPARLGIGSTGQVLTVAAGLPSWATPASGGGMTLLSTTTMSGATVTLSNISQSYEELFIKIYGMTNDSTNINFIFKPNGTANLAVGPKIEGTTVGQYAEQNIQLNGSSGLLRTGGENVWAISIQNYNSTARNKTYSYQGYMVNSASSAFYGVMSAGGIKIASSAITSLEFSNSSGVSFTGGTILLYGVK